MHPFGGFHQAAVEVDTERNHGFGFVDVRTRKELGATSLLQPLKVSCTDHEGGGAVKFQQWDGTKWKLITDWISSDQSIVRPMVEESAAKYAKEKGITPRDCSKE